MDARALQAPEAATVSVSEIACPLPGCPPLETVCVWIAEQRYQFSCQGRWRRWSSTIVPSPG